MLHWPLLMPFLRWKMLTEPTTRPVRLTCWLRVLSLQHQSHGLPPHGQMCRHRRLTSSRLPCSVPLRTRYQFIQRGCFVHGFDDIPFQEINMSVFQFRKTPLHRQGDPVENTGNFTCDPRQHESTECGFHHFSGVSGILQFLCVGLRTRKSMAFVLNSPWLEICLAGLPQFFNLPAQLFVLNFSIPFGIPFYDGGRVIKHLITLATASQNGHSLFLPVLNGTDTRTENVSQLLFVDFHCSFHGQKQRKETTEAKKLAFSTCRFLSFQRVF